MIRPSDAVEVSERWLPSALVTPEARRGILDLARLLPACAESVGFECVLAADVDTVDLGVAVPACGRSALDNREHDPLLDRTVELEKRWRRIVEFARTWGDPLSGLEVRVPFIFLEFDADGSCQPIPIPSVFVALDWLLDELSQQGGSRISWGGAPGFLQVVEILRTLRGSPLEPEVASMLLRCFDAVPIGGVVLHVAAMLSRPGCGVRLSVSVPQKHAVPYLAELGWRAGLRQLESDLQRYALVADFDHEWSRVQLDFDVGIEVGERIGVTLRPRSDSGWSALLSTLVSECLCTAAKRDALLAWPGVSADWPPGAQSPCVTDHYISHLKLVCASNQPSIVKAYFGVTPRSLHSDLRARRSRGTEARECGRIA
ncbi:MAG: hypothetical protein HYR72_15115 [Deltaproteobacteria bacterium]|nr:hypothetical protein [Deltaproteobacteria bacterium]MBI3390936.1 hypothetical protein [Deltaproteobacteria bacterium]